MSTTVELGRMRDQRDAAVAELDKLRAGVETLDQRYTNAAYSLRNPTGRGKRAVYLRCRDDLRKLLTTDADS